MIDPTVAPGQAELDAIAAITASLYGDRETAERIIANAKDPRKVAYAAAVTAVAIIQALPSRRGPAAHHDWWKQATLHISRNRPGAS